MLYFSILKHPGRSPLLAVALEGISAFAHLINLDFFRDLLSVLRGLIVDDSQDEGSARGVDVRTRLQAVVTAFDLLSGQGEQRLDNLAYPLLVFPTSEISTKYLHAGEALTMDLDTFINALFALLHPSPWTHRSKTNRIPRRPSSSARSRPPLPAPPPQSGR